jgi:hypothetical protein
VGDVHEVVGTASPQVDVVLVEQLDRLDQSVAVFDLGYSFTQLVVSLEGAVRGEDIADNDLAVEVLADKIGDDATRDTGAGSDYKQTHQEI